MTCRDAFVSTFFLVLGFSAARAELSVIEDAEGQQGLTVYRMTVTPAAEPVPALKYRLTLRPHESRPGNAAIHYTRVHAENILSSDWRGVREKFGEAVYDWCDVEDTPLSELPLEDLREASRNLDNVVTHFIRPGTLTRDSDWGLALEDLRGLETISYFLPDFQSTRTLARILALRTRLRIAEHDYDSAIEHLRMNYRLAHDVGQEMFLVCNLIGLAIEGIANKTLLDLVAAPDSPNLYWALAELPEPLVQARDSVRLEMSLGLRVFPALMEVETAEYSDEKWSRLLAEALIVFQQLTELEGLSVLPRGRTGAQEIMNQLASTAVAVAAYPAAKARLKRSGFTEQRLDEMPVGQVVLIDVAREYQKVADDMEKWWYLPYPLTRERLDSARRNPMERADPLNGGKMLAEVLLPAMNAVKSATTRLRCHKNALMTIEALRMHAAILGRFPAGLDEIEHVPVPENPATGKRFNYRLSGETAMLELPFSDGMPGMSWRFEIQLAK